MANSGKHANSPSKFLLPIAVPFISRIPTSSPTPTPTPVLSMKKAVEGCQHFLNLIESALIECRQTINRTVNSLTSNNPLVERLICLSNQYKNIFQTHLQRMRQTDSLSSYNFAAILPGDSVAEMVVTNGLSNFLNIYNTLLITRLVLTWFPNSPPAIVNPLSTLCDPYLNIFRGVIPPLGGLDLSPILAFFLLNALTNAAAALPAELPKGMESTQELASIPIQSSSVTAKQKLWLKRQCSSSDVQRKDGHSK
ncbi:ylmG homolog protein 2, chloroplastic isoform X2 [Cryptomeria japonica]|uniref:ylmG homolog protein 2, chloroplastic isoform X2 n=1 Tax=Cryptomeria japonica TaxID=3369 RepID=UPI0025AC4FDD|nr:ylmG homolog protein 2, chloroplastic isoform X2 [Cryptomeria japonica]